MSIANAYNVVNENAITIGDANNNLDYLCDNSACATTTVTIPAEYPKGTNAFYCMKYEISQGQYADFLNHISSTQATNRFPNKNGSDRHTISESGGVYSASAPERACSYLLWTDVAAYLDWACLRPMSELEYEKACRGTQAFVADEYAWGSATHPVTPSGTTNTDQYDEGGTAGSYCNINNTYTEGTMRCGWPEGGSRTLAGATAYGIMEMTGNVWEMVIACTDAGGRSYTGVVGDGVLAANGDQNQSFWPANSTTGLGVGLRGGIYDDARALGRVSARNFCPMNDTFRWADLGGRGLRTP